MKKLINAYYDGRNERPQVTSGRAWRLAHKVGGAIASHQNKLIAEDVRQRREQQRAVLERAAEGAQGKSGEALRMLGDLSDVLGKPAIMEHVQHLEKVGSGGVRRLLRNEWFVDIDATPNTDVFDRKKHNKQIALDGDPLDFIFGDGQLDVDSMTISVRQNADTGLSETVIWLNPHHMDNFDMPTIGDDGNVTNLQWGKDMRIDIDGEGVITAGRKSNAGSGYREVSFETQAIANNSVGYLFNQIRSRAAETTER